jgi:hypothetical protein
MWSDTLLAAERAHLARLLVWASASVIAGAALLLFVSLRGTNTPLLRQFGIQALAWGAIDLGIVAWAWRGLRLRDHAGAMGLVRFLWLNVGLDLGYVGVGATLALAGWIIARHLGAVGAGVGVVTQGLALLVLDGVFLAHIDRLGING